LRAFPLGAAIADPPYLLGFDGFDQRVVFAEVRLGIVVEMVFLLDVLFGQQALGVARAIGDEIVVLHDRHWVDHG
jgi:hypothetical protein